MQLFEQKSAQLKLLFSSAYEGDWMAFFLGQIVLNEIAFQRILNDSLFNLVDTVVEEDNSLANREVKNADQLISSEIMKNFKLLEWDTLPLHSIDKELISASVVKPGAIEKMNPLFTEIIRCHKSLQINL